MIEEHRDTILSVINDLSDEIQVGIEFNLLLYYYFTFYFIDIQVKLH